MIDLRLNIIVVENVSRSARVGILFLLAATILVLGGCGTVASFKTAKLTDVNRPEYTIGASYHDVPFQNKGYSNDVVFRTTARPDFAIWARLGGEQSLYDAGLNFSLPVPNALQVTVRRHIASSKNGRPEMSIGLQARNFDSDLIVGTRLYNSSYHDIGLPVYLSWQLPISLPSEVYTNITPLIRFYQFKAGTAGENANYNDRIFGGQISVGIKLSGFFFEYDAVPLSNGFMQTQAGIAYAF